MKYDLYAIGNAIMDLQVHAADEDLEQLSLAKGTMRLTAPEEQSAIIDHLSGRKIHQASGGSAANTVIGLAQLGGSSSYGCLVGDDLFGRAYCREMAELGVKLHTPPQAGKATGTSVIIISPDAERTMNTYLGVSSEFGAEHISQEMLSDASWLYIEGYLLASEAGRAAAKRAAGIAKAQGVKIAVTFSDTFIVELFTNALRDILAAADLAFANYGEGRSFSNAESPEEILESLCTSVPNAALTLGADGALISYQGEVSRVDALPVVPVDLTGAGDMFAGAFLYGITHGMNGRKSGELACFLAGRVVSQLGPRLAGSPRQAAVEAGLLPR